MTLDDYAAAVATLEPDDFTKTGKPKLGALNRALAAAGHDEIDTASRDDLHEAAGAAETPPEADDDIPGDDVTFDLIDAPTDPVTLRVYGLGEWTMAVGRTHTLPLAAYNVLCQTNATVKEIT